MNVRASMKIKAIRKITRAARGTISTACGEAPANGLEKPPC